MRHIRIRKIAFVAGFLIACWFGMQLVHELGHVVAATLSGATVERVVMFPISRTDTSGVEFPLFVYAAGAVFGSIFPVVLWLIARLFCRKFSYLFRFFAGFCLVANGAYVGCDFSSVGPTDAGLLIEHGASRAILIIFGMLALASGLVLWNGQSQHFFPKSETCDSNT